MEEAPFKLGDKVKFASPKYYGKKAYLNNVARNVIAVKKSCTCRSGWSVDVDGQNFQKLSICIKGHDSGWFVKISEPNETEKLLEKIYSRIDQGLSNAEIDKSFQRHVSKVDLIQCIRFLNRRRL